MDEKHIPELSVWSDLGKLRPIELLDKHQKILQQLSNASCVVVVVAVFEWFHCPPCPPPPLSVANDKPSVQALAMLIDYHLVYKDTEYHICRQQRKRGQKKIRIPKQGVPSPPQHDLKNLKKHNLNSEKKKMWRRKNNIHPHVQASWFCSKL